MNLCKAPVNRQDNMRNVTVFQENGVYAGWPANHGAWQWGDEFLVGFIRGKYGNASMHNVVGPLEKIQARSLDGGETWTIENPGVDFEAEIPEAPPRFSLNDAIIRVCGGYDHGGEACHAHGGFYLSRDRGRTWDGSFKFAGLEDIFSGPRHCTARTRVLGDMIFLSAAQRDHWGSDWIFCATHDGEKFALRAVICDDDCRAVMPAVSRVNDRLVVVARRRGRQRLGGWIDAFVSDDSGLSWLPTSHVAETGMENGNPPALIESDGRLLCAYANRTEKVIDVSVSDDGGYSWTGFKTLRRGENSDIGYPQFFKRSDGQIVCVYYWSYAPGDHQHIEATIFAAK